MFMIKVEAFQQYNTIDIDTNDKETIKRVLNKIVDCPYLGDLIFNFSLQKGIHLKLFCKKRCEMCRIVFDDIIRFMFDEDREEWSKNVMFDKKEFYKAGERIC